MTRKKTELQEMEISRSLDDSLKQDFEVASNVLNNVFGISGEDIKEFFNLMDAEHYLRGQLKHDLELAFLRVDHNYKSVLGNLETAISNYEAIYNNILKRNSAKRMFGAELNSTSIERGLVQVNAPKIPPVLQDVYEDSGPGAWNFVGWYVLYSIIKFQERAESYSPKSGFAQLRDLQKDLKSIFEEAGVAATKKYVGDFLEEFTNLIPFTISANSRMERFVAESAIDSKTGISLALDGIEQFRSSYVALGGNLGAEILGLFPEENYGKFKSLELVAKGIGRLDGRDIDMHLVRDLLRSTNPNQRHEVFDYISKNPHTISLYKSLKRTGLKEVSYVEFLLSKCDLAVQLHDQKQSALETIIDISARPGQAKAAVSLLEHAEEFAFSPRATAIFEIASGYELADIIIRDYFNASRSGQPNKASALLLVGKAKPSSSKLKEIRTRLNTIQDSELEWVNERMNYQELERKLLAQKRPIHQVPAQPSQKEQMHWYDILLMSLRAQNQDENFVENVAKAYAMLNNSSGHRLRNIWKTQPNSLEQFCMDVIEFSDSGAFQHILRNAMLFSAYKSRLKLHDKGYLAMLRKLSKSNGSSVYSQVCNYLMPKRPNAEHQAEQAPASEQMHKNMSRYKRLAIWGGLYSPDAKEKIKNAVPGIKIEVFDKFSGQKDISALKNADAVVFVTTNSSHSVYWAVKDYCKKQGIEFYNFPRSGSLSLISYLQGRG